MTKNTYPCQGRGRDPLLETRQLAAKLGLAHLFVKEAAP